MRAELFSALIFTTYALARSRDFENENLFYLLFLLYENLGVFLFNFAMNSLHKTIEKLLYHLLTH